MNQKSNIFLVGMMGTGKTTIGRRLAKRLGLAFYDSDAEIEQEAQISISWMFDLEGEAKFREREMKMLDRLTQLNGIVLATGGGVVLRPENRQRLRERGIVIYLYATVEELLARTRRGTRPLLAGQDSHTVLTKLLAEREAWYQEIAELSYDTGQGKLANIVEQIVKDLRQWHYPMD